MARPEPLDFQPWREIDLAWLEDDVKYWVLANCTNCSQSAAKAADALRTSTASGAVLISSSAHSEQDLAEAVASIDKQATIVNLDGDDIVVMSSGASHTAFLKWCAENVEWDK